MHQIQKVKIRKETEMIYEKTNRKKVHHIQEQGKLGYKGKLEYKGKLKKLKCWLNSQKDTK